MIPVTRRLSFSMLGAAVAAVLDRQGAKAQATAQEILNDTQIVSTGDVWVEQEAAGSQEITLVQDDEPCLDGACNSGPASPYQIGDVMRCHDRENCVAGNIMPFIVDDVTGRV